MKLNEFFLALDTHKDQVPIETLVDLIEQLDLRRADVEDQIEFDPERYKRNLLQVGTGYAALILCWRAGQRSSIHNHAGSACGVCVLDGVASETKYDRTPDGMLREVVTNIYPTGHVCGSWDADIHVMYNDQPDGRDLVTLHVYTPPMKEVQTYSLDSPEIGTWRDEQSMAAIARLEAARAQTTRA